MSKYIVKAKKTSLKAPLATNATSVILRSLQDSKGNNIELASIGDWAVIVIKQGNNVEMIKISAISFADDDTATLTVATNGRHLNPTTPYTGSANGLSFQSGAEVIITNDPLTVSQFGNKNIENTWALLQTFLITPILPASDPITDNQATRKAYVDALDATNVHRTGNETVAGVKTFSSSPIIPAPTTDMQPATKKYADDLAIAGAPDASETVKGLVEKATLEEFLKGEETGSTGAPLFVSPTHFNGTIEYECGEDIEAGDAVSLVTGTIGQTIGTSASGSNATVSATSWVAQSFKTSPITKKLTYFGAHFVNANQSTTYTIKLRATLNGADLATHSETLGYSNGSQFGLAQDINVDVDPDTTYYIIAYSTNVAVVGSQTNTYSDGSAHKSTDSGANWSAHDTIEDFSVFFTETDNGELNGKIIKTVAEAFNQKIGFVGFALETKDAEEMCQVGLSSLVSMTDLVAGADYYLSETAGEIQQATGNNQLVNHAVGGTNKDFDNLKWKAQSFTTSDSVKKISNLTLRLRNTNGTSYKGTVSIRETIDGADLWVSKYTPATSYAEVSFSPNLVVDPSTTYYIVVRNTSDTQDGDIEADSASTYGTVHYSNDGGANWTTDTGYRWYLKITEKRNPNILRWVGKALSTTVLDRMLGRRRKVSSWSSISGSFTAPTQMQIQMEHAGYIYVDGVEIANSTDRDATPFIEVGDNVAVTGGKYIILQ